MFVTTQKVVEITSPDFFTQSMVTFCYYYWHQKYYKKGSKKSFGYLVILSIFYKITLNINRNVLKMSRWTVSSDKGIFEIQIPFLAITSDFKWCQNCFIRFSIMTRDAWIRYTAFENTLAVSEKRCGGFVPNAFSDC